MSKHIELAREIAYEAGSIMRSLFNTRTLVEWKAEDRTPVTEADRRINDLLIQKIPLIFPEYAILAEEESLERQSEYAVVADPLDGTFPFTNGIPTFAFSLAYTKNGEPFACVVYDPICDRMYTAEKGMGAYMNGDRIFVKKWPPENKNERLSVGISWGWGQRDLSGVHQKIIAAPGIAFSIASAVYSGMLVASGQLAASIYPVKFPWDGAAIKLLVEEAGGRVTDLLGNEQRWDKPLNGCIAAPPLLHEELLKMVAES